MRDLPEAVDDLDLINAMDAGRQTTVDAEDLVVDDAGEGEVVEHVGKVVPDSSIAVLAAAFGIEAVRLGDTAGLVIATDQMNAVRVAQFETDQQRDGLDTKEAAINVVAEEQVVGVWTRAADFEDLEQVEELAVDVANDGYGSLDVDDIALLHEHLLGLCAYGLDDRLGKQLLLVEPLNALVKIDAGGKSGHDGGGCACSRKQVRWASERSLGRWKRRY